MLFYFARYGNKPEMGHFQWKPVDHVFTWSASPHSISLGSFQVQKVEPLGWSWSSFTVTGEETCKTGPVSGIILLWLNVIIQTEIHSIKMAFRL